MRLTKSYGRILRWTTHAGGMQLRRRSSNSSSSSGDGAAVAPLGVAKRSRKTTARVKIKEKVVDVKEEIAVAEVVGVRRSPRKRVKVEVKEEIEELEVEGELNGGGNQENTKQKRKRIVIKRGEDGKPEHWEEVLSGIKAMRATRVADVDVAGVEVMFDVDAHPPHITRFHVLISAMLSSQTKDPVNAAAMKRLIAHGLTVQDMLDIGENELAQLIRPVGFFNNKAKYIKQVAQILKDRADGAEIMEIPNTFDELVALPGVGPKMAHLIMSCAWNNTVGICVDTHVHRISNRLGWVHTWNKKNPKSQDPEKTRKELEEWLPREHWNPINVTLVGFGQTVCLPRGPKCTECSISHLCPSAFSSAI